VRTVIEVEQVSLRNESDMATFVLCGEADDTKSKSAEDSRKSLEIHAREKYALGDASFRMVVSL